jgi:unsaturated rhamnogalacturonyl hydrolase
MYEDSHLIIVPFVRGRAKRRGLKQTKINPVYHMKFNKKLLGFLFSVCILFNSHVVAQTPMSQKMANTIISASPTYYSTNGSSWDYVTGTVMKGFQELYVSTNNVTYYNYIKATVDNEVTTTGGFKTYSPSGKTLDAVREGSSVIFMHQQTSTVKYKTAATTIRGQLNTGVQSRTSEGGFWHKEVYPWQMWQDGLYMAEPFYAEYSKLYNNSATDDFDDIAKQFILMETHARDTKTGLIYHGWSEQPTSSASVAWANPTTGCSKCFWGRAMGWYAMALVDVLDYFPANHPKRAELVSILQRLMAALVPYQEPITGCWYQVVDYTTTGYGPANGNYLESSASIMFIYTMLKAVRLGYIDSSYKNIATKAYTGYLTTFVTESNGKLTISNTCGTAGLGGSGNRSGTFAYYMSEAKTSNDGKTTGPFILASLEIENKATDLKQITSTNKLDFKISSNPVINSLVVTFSLDKPSNVDFSVLDINGKVINTIHYEYNSAGEYRETIPVTNLSDGIYMLKMKSDRQTQSQKFIITKNK